MSVFCLCVKPDVLKIDYSLSGLVRLANYAVRGRQQWVAFSMGNCPSKNLTHQLEKHCKDREFHPSFDAFPKRLSDPTHETATLFLYNYIKTATHSLHYYMHCIKANT